MFPQIYCGKIGERAKRAPERRLRPHTTHDLEHSARQQEWAGRVLELLVDFFGVSFLEVFSSPNVHCFDPRDAQRAEALRKVAEAQDELRRPTTKSVQQENRRLNSKWRRTA